MRKTIVQSCVCNLTQQPQSILWKLHVAADNTPRQKAMRHQKASRMATHTVLFMQEGRVEGGYSKSYTTKRTKKKTVPLPLLPWSNAFLFGIEV